MGEEHNSFTLAELLTFLRRVMKKLPGLLWLCSEQRSQQWFMSQREGVQSVPRGLTGSSQLSWEAECWPWINYGNLGKSLVFHGVWKLLCEWNLHSGSPGVAAPHFGAQRKPGLGIANTLGSDRLPFLLREVKFGGLNHNQSCQHQVIFQGSRAEGTASHPWWGFCPMSCNMTEPHSPSLPSAQGYFLPF